MKVRTALFRSFPDEHTDNGQNPDNKQTPVRRRLIICTLYVPSYSDMIWILYHIRRIQNWNALHELFSYDFLDFLYQILKNVINLENRNAGKFSGWVFPFSKGTVLHDKNSESFPEWQNIWTELTLDFGILFITGSSEWLLMIWDFKELFVEHCLAQILHVNSRRPKCTHFLWTERVNL